MSGWDRLRPGLSPKEDPTVAISAHDAIFVDNQKAHDYAMKYLAAIDKEMFARSLKFTTAMHRFSEFLHLPESSSKLGAFIDTALSVLVLVQPELFLVKFFAEEEKAVKLALTIAEATGSKAAKAVKIGQKVSEVAEKVKGVKEKVDGFKEKQAKKREAPEASERLKQLAESGKPAEMMMAAYEKAQRVWSDALDTLDKELENRLDDKAGASKESLEAIARRLLRFPDPLGVEELEQIETALLWELVSAWAKANVTLIDIPPSPGIGYLGGMDYKGINDTQRETLQEWFGFRTKRGTIFNKPAFPNEWTTLVLLGAKIEKRKAYTGLPRVA
jgi:outer membrane murein-binding lipoprotein Lpp